MQHYLDTDRGEFMPKDRHDSSFCDDCTENSPFLLRKMEQIIDGWEDAGLY